MPVYNDAAHLPGAVQRSLGLRGVDVQLVIVDDCSTDGTREIAQRAAADDPRVEVVTMPQNQGVAAARQAGVRAAAGEWVWFVDSDDHWPLDGLAALVHALPRGVGGELGEGVDVVVAGAVLVEPSGVARPITSPSGSPRTGAEAVRLLLRGEITGHLWTKLFRRALLLRAEFPTARVQSDLALVAGVLSLATSVVTIPDQVYEYRKRQGSIITSGARRAESLVIVDGFVQVAALRAGVEEGDPDLDYFRLRYIALSSLKDALEGAYPEPESRLLVAQARRRIGARGLLLLVSRGDKRVGLALLAYAPWGVQARLLRRRLRLRSHPARRAVLSR